MTAVVLVAADRAAIPTRTHAAFEARPRHGRKKAFASGGEDT